MRFYQIKLCTLPLLAFTSFTLAQSVPQEDLELYGSWDLKTVVCEDGTAGEMRYDAVHLSISGDEINATLTKDGCEISIEGTTTSAGKVITTEFTTGSWTECSGSSLPTYVFNRFEAALSEEEEHLTLSGADLTPFASCKGQNGHLKFE